MTDPLDHYRNPTRARLDGQAIIVAEIECEHLLALALANRARRAERARQGRPIGLMMLPGANFDAGKSLWPRGEHDFGR